MTHKMGLIIPYRNREEHLKKFIPHIQKFLKDFPYHLFIVEQTSEKPFNRGKLLNIGFKLAKSTCDYVCFHDVDMLPVTADYSFPEQPTHLATQVGQFAFEMPYPTYFGGVTLFNVTDFEKVNGFCNQYWVWGSEDDDLRARCENVGLKIVSRTGTYISLPHPVNPQSDPLVLANRERQKEFISGNIQLQEDGLKTLQYELQNEQHQELISHSLVKI